MNQTLGSSCEGSLESFLNEGKISFGIKYEPFSFRDSPEVSDCIDA